MKVLHVIPGLGDGGAEAVLYRLCANDRRAQHVVVSLMSAGKYGPRLRTAGVEVHCLGMQQGRLSWQGVLRLWRLLRDQRPALVQTWMYHGDLIGGVLARLAGVRTVLWNVRHTTLERRSVKRTTRMVVGACVLASRAVPAHIVCCAEEAKRVHAGMGYPSAKMTVIPNGYDVKHLAPDSSRREALRRAWSVRASEPLLGMVARFDPQKDHANLLAALGRLAARGVGFKCVLVGPGVDAGNETLRALATHHGVSERVTFLGPRDDIPAVMNALDLHVLSSRYGEAFPNVLAEAMACGTPCVTTDLGDARRIVGSSGWVVPAADSALLATAIEEALTEMSDVVGWRARQSEARQRIVDAFAVGSMVDAYHEVWRATLRTDRRPPDARRRAPLRTTEGPDARRTDDLPAQE